MTLKSLKQTPSPSSQHFPEEEKEVEGWLLKEEEVLKEETLDVQLDALADHSAEFVKMQNPQNMSTLATVWHNVTGGLGEMLWI